jgi:dolichyl-diphosphooligosaccharide--protein glycosyltransferase
MRVQPAQYGLELNEYDPFFNYRASKYLLENGLDSYNSWNDDKSLYPNGRDISKSSQVMLHVTTVALYKVFPFTDFKTFVIILPPILGSLTSIIMFFFTRNLFGNRIATFASLFFAISYPVIMRGTVGWFKSEPLGLFLGLGGLLLFLIGLRKSSGPKSYLASLGGGVLLAFGTSAWGGVFGFMCILFLFIAVLPFVRKYNMHSTVNIITVMSGFLAASMLFERQYLLISSNIFLFISPLAVYIITGAVKTRFRTRYAIVSMVMVLSFTVLLQYITVVGPDDEPGMIVNGSGRYLRIINPLFEKTSVYSGVAEHLPLNPGLFLEHNSFLIMLTGIGVIALIKSRLDLESKLFLIILSLVGGYMGANMIRLELFISIGMSILSSIGIIFLFDKFVTGRPKKQKLTHTLILTILIGIMVLNSGHAWAVMASTPPTILRGGGFYMINTTDWHDAMDWLKKNTPEGSVIFAWWDYGYWITTLSDRATIMDNSTTRDDVIIQMAKALFSPYDQGVSIVKSMGANYVLTQVILEKDGETYKLNGGGDINKIKSIQRTAGADGFVDGGMPTEKFWSDTLFGRITPFTNTGDGRYSYQVKDTPGMELVYVSPGMKHGDRYITAIFIYKI